MEALALTPARTHADRRRDQIQNVPAWQAQARAQRDADLAVVTGASRELRLDARRRLDSLERAERALLARAEATAQSSPRGAERDPRPVLAVIAHRHEWLRHKVALALGAEGVDVLAVVDDGADAVGVVVAEQPDLLVLEDRLPSLPGLDVVQEMRAFAPHTTVAAQVESTSPATMVAAGAAMVFSRRVPPATIAEHAARLLRGVSTGPLVLT